MQMWFKLLVELQMFQIFYLFLSNGFKPPGSVGFVLHVDAQLAQKGN